MFLRGHWWWKVSGMLSLTEQRWASSCTTPEAMYDSCGRLDVERPGLVIQSAGHRTVNRRKQRDVK